ncbi:hypothetical protein B0187_05375 [Haemophilus paracuniculus]|uniref:Zn-ribbon-containing protein n=1 Tax=Haemophilus paracuniculus TaxID=734 RepID=A0A1T0ARY5_9PAST|nr:Zn-ribbon-containing protein [Haemophilus paracuniculus]OOR99189.1 hypothetical protein B0187_05375 [Haemophilus paracuniculus]
MYQAIAHFRYTEIRHDTFPLVSHVVEQWRDNGQIIGREFGITRSPQMISVRVAIPEQDSLMPEWNSEGVNEAQKMAQQAGILFDSFEIVGLDYQADTTSKDDKPSFYILYTTHLDSCSPLYNGDDFCPVPLYRVLQNAPELANRVIKWQENWQACDQLQMNGDALEQEALAQISDYDSTLSQQGIALCREIEALTGIPTYYYLYRLGTDEQTERERKCPATGKDWLLAEPLHHIFHFKCDESRLLSNLSWEIA